MRRHSFSELTSYVRQEAHLWGSLNHIHAHNTEERMHTQARALRGVRGDRVCLDTVQRLHPTPNAPPFGWRASTTPEVPSLPLG